MELTYSRICKGEGWFLANRARYYYANQEHNLMAMDRSDWIARQIIFNTMIHKGTTEG